MNGDLAEMKKPMIPTVKDDSVLKLEGGSMIKFDGRVTERSLISEIPVRREGDQVMRLKIVNKSLKEENRKLNKLI